VKGWLLTGRGLRLLLGIQLIEGHAKESVRWDILQAQETCCFGALAAVSASPTSKKAFHSTTMSSQVAQPSVQSRRHRALLIGVLYCGELLNAHQNVDRYRNVLRPWIKGECWHIFLT
jgi:hypothetical protein